MSDDMLRRHLIELLRGRWAHADFDAVIRDLPPQLRGVRPDGHPHTAWQLLEHLRIAQRDILEFSRNAEHVSPEFPDGYWPQGDAPPDDDAWNNSVQAVRDDLQEMISLVSDTSVDLFSPIPHGDGQTILREALLVADHNAYHLGQLLVVRRALCAWGELEN